MNHSPDQIDVLVVRLDEIKVGCLISHVDEVLPACFITPLESAETIVEGIINLRGEPTPVFPLRRRFGLPYRQVTPGDFFLVSAGAPMKFAARVDEVIGVQRLSREAIRPVSSGIAHIDGVISDETSVILITDLGQVISAADVINLREIISRLKSS